MNDLVWDWGWAVVTNRRWKGPFYNIAIRGSKHLHIKDSNDRTVLFVTSNDEDATTLEEWDTLSQIALDLVQARLGDKP